MKYVKNGQLVAVDGDKRKAAVTEGILAVIMKLLEKQNK
jgi:hypothetical protein